MKTFFQSVGGIILVVAFIVAVMFGSFFAYQYFAPKYVEVETEVYRESRSYVEGMIRDLRKLKREYEAADEEHKSALRTIILQRSDEIDHDKLPADVRRFIESL